MASVAVYPVGQQEDGCNYTDRWNGPDEWGNDEAPSWQRESIRPSQCEVRSFPNEDVLFWSKPEIDNSRVVRQEDPQAVRDCWKSLSAAAAVVVVAVGLLLPKAYGLISGMELEHARERNAVLQEKRRLVKLEESRLTSPERLEQMAVELGFGQPSPEHVVRLGDRPDAAERDRREHSAANRAR